MEEIYGRYYKSIHPKEVFIPCVKYKLPSKDPSGDGVDEIIYAESLHYQPGRFQRGRFEPVRCELNLKCPTDTKAFYKVDLESSVKKDTNNTLVVSSQNEDGEQYTFMHQD